MYIVGSGQLTEVYFIHVLIINHVHDFLESILRIYVGCVYMTKDEQSWRDDAYLCCFFVN